MGWLYDGAISFGSGAGYGLTSVVLGQPFDTVKTRMQARPGSLSLGALRVGADLFRAEGVRGLYRGGFPLVVGGTLLRSAQFGCYEATLAQLRARGLLAERVCGGVLDPAVVVAGFMGGVGRGLVEAPFELIKVRRQLAQEWSARSLLEGSGATMLRNAFLFASFVVYIDLSKQVVEGGLSPFWTGALCSNAAWLTVWPLDVVKTQRMSGHYGKSSIFTLLADVTRSGALFRGVLPGLTRSTIANGCGMVVYKEIEAVMRRHQGDGDSAASAAEQ